jgi:hypothetical protein
MARICRAYLLHIGVNHLGRVGPPFDLVIFFTLSFFQLFGDALLPLPAVASHGATSYSLTAFLRGSSSSGLDMTPSSMRPF